MNFKFSITKLKGNKMTKPGKQGPLIISLFISFRIKEVTNYLHNEQKKYDRKSHN